MECQHTGLEGVRAAFPQVGRAQSTRERRGATSALLRLLLEGLPPLRRRRAAIKTDGPVGRTSEPRRDPRDAGYQDRAQCSPGTLASPRVLRYNRNPRPDREEP